MKIVDGKKVIWETNNFEVVASDHPFISREEGGHIIIRGKDNKYRYNSRLDFSPSDILEQQRLCQMICEAYKKAMQKRNIKIVRFNFFEAGNWAWKKGNAIPYYREHIFGRTLDAKKQKFPDAPYLPDRKSGFYDDFEPLNDDDIKSIIQEIKKLDNCSKYSNNNWNLISN